MVLSTIMLRFPTKSYRECIGPKCPNLPIGLLENTGIPYTPEKIQVMFCSDDLDIALRFVAENYKELIFKTIMKPKWLETNQLKELQARK